jgi:hypothetical protein
VSEMLTRESLLLIPVLLKTQIQLLDHVRWLKHNIKKGEIMGEVKKGKKCIYTMFVCVLCECVRALQES